MQGIILSALGRGLETDPAGLLLRSIKAQQQTVDTTLEKALVSLENGQIHTAEQLICQASDQPKWGPWAALLQAGILLSQHRYTKALDLLEEVTSHRPDLVSAMYVLGLCYEQTGQPAKAVNCYQDCLKLTSQIQLPIARLAAISLAQMQVEGAIEYYMQLHQADPQDMLTDIILGQLNIAVDRPDQSRKAFENAILLSPGAMAWQDPDLELLIHDGQLHQALAKLDQLASLDQSPELMAKRGQILLELDQQDQALQWYQASVAACPTYLEAQVKLAGIYMATGDLGSAAIQYLRALDANELHVEAYTWLARSYKAVGRSDLAMDMLASAYELAHNSTELLLGATKALLQDAHQRQNCTTDMARQAILQLCDSPAQELAPVASYIRMMIELGSGKRPQISIHTDEPAFANGTASLVQTDIEQAHWDLTLERGTLQSYYQLAVCGFSPYKLAGAILNLATQLHYWPTPYIARALAAVGIYPRHMLIYEFLRCGLGDVAQ